MYEIEGGIEIPVRLAARYPFAGMEVGESFFVPDGDVKKLSNHACRYGKKSGRRYCVRKVEGGVRVWRVE
jgi:hypothetical protein